MDKPIIPEDLRYTKTHEWVKVEDGVATMGITDFAQQQFGEIVFVDFSVEEGDSVKQEEPIATIESTKAVNEVYASMSGTIVETNMALLDSLDMLNKDPYDEGWLVRIEVSDISELDGLLDADEYAEFCEQEE